MQSYAQNCATLKPVTSQPCVETDKPDRRCLGKLWLVRCSYCFDMYRKAECHCTCEKLVQHSRRLPQVQLGAAIVSPSPCVAALPVVSSLVISWPRWPRPGCISCSSQEAGRLGAPTDDCLLLSTFFIIFLHLEKNLEISSDVKKGFLDELQMPPGLFLKSSLSPYQSVSIHISIHIFALFHQVDPFGGTPHVQRI